MKQIKKLFCIALALIFVMGILPTIPVAAADNIDAISLNVVAPVAGKNPSYQASQLSQHIFLDTEDETYGVCQSNGIIWFTQSGNAMLPTETFKVGKRYTVRVMLGAETPYGFTETPTVTVNGAEGYVSYRYSASWMDIEYEFPAVQGYTITFNAGSGSGTMDPVTDVAGDYQLPQCTFTPPYSTQEFKCWKISTDSKEWYPGDTIPVHQNITVTAVWKNKSTKQQICNVVATSDDLDTTPVLYEKFRIPEFAITKGSPAYIAASSGNFRWQKKVNGVWETQDGDYFTPGEWRADTQVRIDGADAADYELGAPFTLSVNGKPWTVDGDPIVHADYSLVFVYSPVYVIDDNPNIKPPVDIEKVTFRLDGYYDGFPVANAKLVTDAAVKVTRLQFGEIIDSNKDGMPDSIDYAKGNFDAKKQYAIFFSFEAKKGYNISKLTKAAISLECASQEMEEFYSEENDDYECIYLLKAATHKHVYDKKVATSKYKVSSATCKKKATYKKSCSCGKAGTATFESGSLGSHNYKTEYDKATITKNGKKKSVCSVCKHVKSSSTIYYVKTVKLSNTSYTYNGKTQAPSVIVKDSKGNTILPQYYTVTYPSSCKNVGSYKVVIKFKTRYSGSKTLTFKINPKKTSVSKLTAGKKSLKVTVKKQSTQVTGYQIQYSTSKKFTSAKTKTVSYKTTTVSLKNLSAKKTYYVRVRTYKTVNGKKYYSGWSTYKYAKTK